MYRNRLRTWALLLVLATCLVALTVAGTAFAADGHITGTVTDGSTGLEGIRVVPHVYQAWNNWWEVRWDLAGTTLADGTYDISVPPETYRLRFDDPAGMYGYQFWPGGNVPYAGEDIVVGDGGTASGKDIVLPGAAWIAGRVTADAGGAGLANIGVAAAAEYNGMWYWLVGARTETDGNYALSLPPGSYKINFYDDDDWAYATECYNNVPPYEIGLAEVIDVDTGMTIADINAGLADAASIEGTVTGSSAAIGNAQVMLAAQMQDGNWNWIAQQTTGTDGAYKFEGLHATGYRLQFSDPGGFWVTECWDNQANLDVADVLSLAVGEHRTEVSADLTPAGRISGTVTGYGVGALENIGVAANIQVGDWLEAVSWTQTDASGVYTLGGLAEGSYIVSFGDGTGQWLFENYDNARDWHDATPVSVIAGGTTTGINAELDPASHIIGTVTDGTNPLAGIQVVPVVWMSDGGGGGWYNQQWHLAATTDTNGQYDIGGLTQGTCWLLFQDPAGNWAAEYFNNAIQPLSGNEITLGFGDTVVVDAQLTEAAHIRGRVTSDGSTGIANINVAAGPFDTGNGNYQHIAWTQTDADGYYDLGGLPAVAVRIQFWDDSGTYLTELYDNVRDPWAATDIELTVGGTAEPIDAVLELSSHITGTVTDGASPIEGIQVVPLEWQGDGEGGGWWNQRWDWSTQTASDGTYDVSGLFPGTYRLMFQGSNVWATEFWPDAITPTWGTDIVLGLGESAVANAQLSAAAHITGRVTSDGSTGIGNITVAAGPFDVDSGYYEHIAWTQTDADGFYDLAGLPATTVRVQFWDDSGNYLSECYNNVRDWTQATDVNLEVGGTVPDINAQLDAASHITGTVTGAGVGPLENMHVIPLEWQDDGEGGGWWNQRWDLGAWTGTEGTYDILGLMPGTYRLMFRDEAGLWATEFFDNVASSWEGADITLGIGESASDINAELDLGGYLTGTVTGAGYGPLEGIGVNLNIITPEGQEGIAWTQTDGNGDYTFGGLATGEYVVNFDGNMDWLWEMYDNVRDWESVTPVGVIAGNTTSGIDAELDPASHISGIVIGDGVGPLEGIAVMPATWQDDGEGGGWWEQMWWYQSMTAADGTYDVGGLEPNTYKLLFQDPAGNWAYQYWENAESAEAGTEIALGLGQSVTDINVTLVAGGSITGNISGFEAGPIEGMWVMASDPATWEDVQWAQTDASGNYVLAGLRTGDFIVRVEGSYDWRSEWYQDVHEYESATPVSVVSGSETPGIDFVLSPTSKITGIVTGADAAGPLADVTVLPMQWMWDEWGGGWWEQLWWNATTTGADGAYEISGLEPGTYRVMFIPSDAAWAIEFWDDARAPGAGTDIDVGDGETRTGVNAELAAAGSVSGVVTGFEAGPVQDVQVTATDPSTGDDVTAIMTGQDGTYSITGLAAGDWIVHVYGNYDWLDAWYNGAQGFDDATPVTVVAGDDTPSIDFELTPTCRITGQVLGDGVPLGDGEANVVPIRWVDDGEGGGWWDQMWWNPAGTWADGRYEIGGLPPGTYRVGFFPDPTVWATEYWDDQPCVSYGDDIVLGAGESAADINADLAPAGKISGRVTSDGSAGLANITVIAACFDPAMDLWDEIQWTQTDADGYYTLEGLPAGSLGVKFYDQSGTWLEECYNDTRDWHTATAVSVTAGETTPDIDAVLAPCSRIRGTVTGAGAGALSDIGVTVYGFNGEWWDWAGESWTQADGTYDVGGLVAGTYRVSFDDWGTWTWASEAYDDVSSWQWGTDIQVADSETREGIDAELSRAGTISGTVIGDGGLGLPGTPVIAGPYNVETDEWDSSHFYVETDMYGQYTIYGLKPGVPYRVTAWDNTGTFAPMFYDAAPNDWHQGDDVYVLADETTICDFDLPPAGKITGHVTDGTGPIEGISVFLYRPTANGYDDFWGSFQGEQAATDADGYYEIRGLSPGEYRVGFGDYTETYASEYFQDASTLRLGETIVVSDYGSVVGDIDAELARAGVIEGVVADTSGDPIPGTPLNVFVRPDSGMPGWVEDLRPAGPAAVTDDTGHYMIGGLRPGEEIVVRADSWYGDWVAEWYDNASTPEEATGVYVASGAVTPDIDFVLAPAGSISGTISLERPSDGMTGISWTVYELVDMGGWTEWVWRAAPMGEMNPTGEWQATGLAAGDYVVEFVDYRGMYATECWDNCFTTASATHITVIPGEDAGGIDAYLELGGWIGGTVTDVLAAPLEGIQVTPYVWDAAASDWMPVHGAGATTGADGTYEMLVPSGSYRVEFFDAANGQYATQWFNAMPAVALADDVAVTAETLTPDIDAVMEVGGALLVSAKDTSDNPINGIGVDIYYDAGAGGWQIVASGDTVAGSCTATGLLPGDYKVRFTDASAMYEECYYDSAVDLASADVVPVTSDTQSSIIQVLETKAAPVTSVIVDPASPDGTNGWYVTVPGVSLTSDEPATIYYAWDDSTPPFADTFWAELNPQEGTHSLYRYGVDSWENTETVMGPTTFKVDTAHPTAGSDTVALYEDSAVIHLTGADTAGGSGIASVSYILDDGGTVTTAGSTKTVTVGTAGAHSLEFWSTDAAGNASTHTTDEFSITSTADVTPPTADDDAVASYNDSATIHLTATDNAGGSGVASISYKLDGAAAWTVVPGASATVSTSDPGDHALSYKAIDVAGNESAVTVVDFAVVRTTPVEEVPIAGETRFDTSVAISEEAFPDGAEWVVIATGRNWPDALGGSALAGALDGPILLTDKSALPASVAAEIERLGSTKAIILGGTTAVGAEVETALNTSLGDANVERIAGSNRYQTADMVGARTIDILGAAYDGTAFVATGNNFPDALGAAPLAAGLHWPLFLASTSGLSADTLAAMDGVEHALILGGTAAVPGAVETGLNNVYGDANVDRLAGSTRYSTAVVVATYGVNHGLAWNRLAIATGQNFPDALAGGVLQGRDGSVMLLTPSGSLDAGVASVLGANKASISEVRYLGGLNAVTQAVRDAVVAALD